MYMFYYVCILYSKYYKNIKKLNKIDTLCVK